LRIVGQILLISGMERQAAPFSFKLSLSVLQSGRNNARKWIFLFLQTGHLIIV
jgi:hypothetical protein